MNTPTITKPTYTEEDHETWSKLVERQAKYVVDLACRQFLDNYPSLRLDPMRLPDPFVVSDRLHSLTGWTLGNAQNEYLNATEWFEHLYECRFPVTNYIRRPNELDYTPFPDLFHEYFGHLAFFADPFFADTAQMFGQLYLAAQNERQQLEIARLWWFSTEFGLVRENGDIKILGAGLLSSTGEMLHALKPETPRFEFDIRHVVETPAANHDYHTRYFILDDIRHLRNMLLEYARSEGLKEPVATR